MPIHTRSLIDFSEPISLYKLSHPVKSLLDLAQHHPSETIVVMDDLGRPMGAIAPEALEIYRQEQTREQKTALYGNIHSLLLPIVTIRVTTPILEWEAYLTAELGQQNREPIIILVDKEGQCLGKLNIWGLMRFVLGELRKTAPRPYSAPLKPLLVNLLDQIPLPVLLYTEDKQILHKNPRWQELIGEGIPQQEYLHRSRSGNKAIAKNESLETASTIALSNLLIYPGLLQDEEEEETIWQMITVPLKVSPERFDPPYWLMLATDVTQHQQCCMELAVKKADLIHLNRLKDEFLACISHELKSPLTAIVGLSNLLKEKQIGELNPRQHRYADLIHRSGRQLMNLVNDLLDLTRLETGQLKLNSTRVSLKEAGQRAYRTLKDKYPDRLPGEIQFSVKIDPHLEYVIADELRLQQMLVHLLDNAIKFTPSGGQIGIKISSWENWLGISVWDTGIGIPEESQGLIFQKFQQLESPLTRQFEGTGLGLVLTQRLAKAHGGDISFISKPGSGSEFTLLLPPYPILESTGLNSLLPSGGKRKLVLIVDSSPRGIELLEDYLERLDYKSIIARSGTEAIEKARGIKPEYIFVNPDLPLLSGWDVLTLIKSDPATQNLKVIVIAPPEARERSENNKADGFLSVPLTLLPLQSLLTGQAALPAAKPLKPPTILRLYDTEQPDSLACSWVWWTQLSQMNYRLLEADSLEQAELLASVWAVDLILIDRTIAVDLEQFFQGLSNSPYLSPIPLITLDAQITQAANQWHQLTVFPCLIPPGEYQVEQLLQVIHIALETQALNGDNSQVSP
ncbi:MAG: Sensor histidine kinase RcsC [Chroococcopsis gigantea SAG 12.99]|jgi:nitrogen-specific signal transduction histidine kinase/CheY-like chemotaxis protein|nr:hybrid sensor histidine kinase/response regulator [Chlorogloea purpurea SAG 13.99]MDV3002064.1 Sensor histidine kinase RcsC [Chroococcopsis gigantea SAG 12.99]